MMPVNFDAATGGSGVNRSLATFVDSVRRLLQ